MTRMKFKLFRSMFLLPFGVLISLTTGELEFYQDAVPEFPEDITIEELARIIEAQNHQYQHQHQHQHTSSLQRSRFPLYVIPRLYREHLAFLRQKEKHALRDTLPKEANIINLLQKQNLQELNYIQRFQHHKSLPYFGLDPVFDQYQEFPHFKEDEKKMKEESFIRFPEKYIDEDSKIESADDLQEQYEPLPQFTYAFNKPKLDDESPFAVAPNDPRYYQETPFVPTEKITTHKHELSNQETNKKVLSDKNKIMPKPMYKAQFLKPNSLDLNMVMEPQRRADQDPVVFSVFKKKNEDVFLIAILAVICAIVMFAVVTLGFVWYRIQRISKAAADIDYPAYGITGPNKDMSPSTDQRLAQSAQMYHFQHQKQQIIAMENRTSATRDPASVSEADSDEENEEGDYTVYECPGLAPTSEMEVKNPMFQDDPTPASPATLGKKEENDV